MKTQILSGSVLVFVLMLLSCQKPQDTGETLIGKWRLDSIQAWMRDPNNQLQVMTVYKSTSDYYDYRTDGYLYRFYNSRYDTIPYSLEKSTNARWLIRYGMPNSADTIQSLSSHKLTLMNAQGGRSRLMLTR